MNHNGLHPDWKTVVAPYTAKSVNQRIPWVFEEADFYDGQYIELGYRFPGEIRRLAIWQENRAGDPDPGDKVRYTKATKGDIPGNPGTFRLDYDPKASAIPGNSNTGGRRILIIKHTGWEPAPTRPFPGIPTMGASLCQPC